MSEPGYPAARAVAPRLQAHFARHRAATLAAGRPVQSPLPDLDCHRSDHRRRVLGQPAPRRGLRAAHLAGAAAARRLALIRCCSSARCRSVPPRSCGSLPPSSGRASTWACGATAAPMNCGSGAPPARLPTACFVLEVSAPGLLVVKHHRSDGGKFVNVAVLEGDQIKVVDERASSLPDCPAAADLAARLRRQRCRRPAAPRTCSSRSPCRCARMAGADCCWSFLRTRTSGASRSSSPFRTPSPRRSASSAKLVRRRPRTRRRTRMAGCAR